MLGQLADQPNICPSCMARTLLYHSACKLFNQMYFAPAMRIGSIDCNHFIPLSVTLRVTRSGQRKSVGLIFLHTSTHGDEIWYGDVAVQVERPGTTFSEIYWMKGSNCCFTDNQKLECWHAFGWFWTNVVQTWYDGRHYWTQQFDTSISDLDPHSRPCVHKSKNFYAKLSHKILNQFGWNLAYCWDLLIWWISHSFYLIQSIFKEENPVNVISFKQN